MPGGVKAKHFHGEGRNTKPRLECRSPVGAGLLAKAVCHSTMMLADLTPSRASPLPQGLFGAFEVDFVPGGVKAEHFHGESRNTKPRLECRSPVGAGLLAKAVCRSTMMLADLTPSRASPLPQGLFGAFEVDFMPGGVKAKHFHGEGRNTKPRLECRSPVGAGLLAKAVCHSTMMLADLTPSRASPLPQGLFGAFEVDFVPGGVKAEHFHGESRNTKPRLECRSPVGAGLLAKAVCHSTMMLADLTPSRASPLPQGLFGAFEVDFVPGGVEAEDFHGEGRNTKPRLECRSPVGEGLLAKAVCHSTMMLADLTPSRASPLSQGLFGALEVDFVPGA
ncbi:hypothetical protein ATI02_5811 [Pseudomonas baetica]|uniref:Uncharacterized protein n=2 Tax=Pseudomonas baetica TaxID=674054 RepID=A0ABX4Q7F5_9PSED|nr:hypothetical protein ATI02_5811 [Pseudomonas baetica]